LAGRRSVVIRACGDGPVEEDRGAAGRAAGIGEVPDAQPADVRNRASGRHRLRRCTPGRCQGHGAAETGEQLTTGTVQAGRHHASPLRGVLSRSFASSASSVKRTLTTNGGSPSIQCPYVVVTKVPSGRTSTPG